MLPLAPFRKTRIVPAYGLYVASFVFGVCVWMYGFIVTYSFWGVGGVFIGLMLGIVGLRPLVERFAAMLLELPAFVGVYGVI